MWQAGHFLMELRGSTFYSTVDAFNLVVVYAGLSPPTFNMRKNKLEIQGKMLETACGMHVGETEHFARWAKSVARFAEYSFCKVLRSPFR